MLSVAFMPIMVTNIVIMGVCCCTSLELSNMQDQTLLTLCWHSCLWGGSDIDAGHCAHKGGRFDDYDLTLSHGPVMIQDSGTEIVDDLLTLISMMVHRECCMPFNIKSPPIIRHWIDMIMQLFDCQKDETQIGDTPLTLTWRGILTVILCAITLLILHTVIIDSQYTISKYNQLHSTPLRPLSCWATTSLVICPRNSVAPSGFSAFCWHSVAYRSIYSF